MNKMTIVDLFGLSFGNPLILSFLFIWIIGWYLKNKTKIENKIIPLILIPSGIFLGLFVIEMSVKGFICGLMISLMQMGGYDLLKSLLELLKYITTLGSVTAKKNKPPDSNHEQK